MTAKIIHKIVVRYRSNAVLCGINTVKMVREYRIDQHSSLCPCSKNPETAWDKYCDLNPKTFIFLINTDFFIVSYHSCMEYGDEYRHKLDIIEAVLKKQEINFTTIQRQLKKSIVLDDELRTSITKAISLQKYIQQIHYIYNDNAGKKYCITSKVGFIDSLINNDELLESYRLTMEYIKLHGYNFLEDQLIELISDNWIEGISEKNIVRTIDVLVNEINKFINDGIDKKSNNKRTP